MTSLPPPELIYTARIDGVNMRFSAPASMPLLQALEQGLRLANQTETPGLQLVSSCRNGTCRTCICQLLEGEVTYRIAWPGLSREEKHCGFILPCVAYPVSDLVIRQIE